MASSNPRASAGGAQRGNAGAHQARESGRATPLGQARATQNLPIDLILPNSRDAEMGVLGAMLLSPTEAGALARERLSETHFYLTSHQIIFREFSTLQDDLKGIDVITLTQRLRDKNLLEEVGGPAYLTDLVTHVPTVANVDHYIDLVWEKSLLRQLIEAAHDVMGKA